MGTAEGEPEERLDQALVRRGLVPSRTVAQQLIRTGRVRIDGHPADRPAHLVTAASDLEVDAERYVSRGAYKLLGALDDLQVRVGGRALDAGSSTGGFSQVLLERGCRPVYAVDVGTDQLSPMLRGTPGLVVRERTNLRDLTLAALDDQPVDVVVADVSFISLRLLLPVLDAVCTRGGQMLLMVKPQFEVGRSRLGKGGVVRDPRDHAEAVDRVAEAADRLGWSERGRAASRLPGPAGNREFFLHLRRAA